MESVLARAEMAPAMVYMVRTVLFSKKARSWRASSEGRSSSVRRFVSWVKGPRRKGRSCTGFFPGRPGLFSSMRALNFSGEEKFILQVQPPSPSVMRQPSWVKWKVQQGPSLTWKHRLTGFLRPLRISLAGSSRLHRFSRAPRTPYIFTYAMAFGSFILVRSLRGRFRIVPPIGGDIFLL